MSINKKPLTGLFRDNPGTPEGKYLIKRRDGTVPPWPLFVLGGADPVAAVALKAYADEVHRLLVDYPETAKRLGFTRDFHNALLGWVSEFRRYRAEHGEGDPGMGKHRVDDPATIVEMKKGRSA